jgi:hypothetical protein
MACLQVADTPFTSTTAVNARRANGGCRCDRPHRPSLDPRRNLLIRLAAAHWGSPDPVHPLHGPRWPAIAACPCEPPCVFFAESFCCWLVMEHPSYALIEAPNSSSLRLVGPLTGASPEGGSDFTVNAGDFAYRRRALGVRQLIERWRTEVMDIPGQHRWTCGSSKPPTALAAGRRQVDRHRAPTMIGGRYTGVLK